MAERPSYVSGRSGSKARPQPQLSVRPTSDCRTLDTRRSDRHWTALDFAHGKNQPYLSPVFGDALAAGGVPSTGNRFNASIGYYF